MRHRSGYAGLLADAYPLRPAVVAAAVRVDHEVAALMVRGRVERGPGHGVGHLGVRRRRGRPARDGAVEQVFGHLKDEFYRGRDWETFEEFKADLEAYSKHWNHVRRQVRLKGLTPVEFRDQALRGAA